MTSFAASSESRETFHASTCFLIGSKFRCMRSTPTERMSTRLRCLVCLASTGVEARGWRRGGRRTEEKAEGREDAEGNRPTVRRKLTVAQRRVRQRRGTEGRLPFATAQDLREAERTQSGGRGVDWCAGRFGDGGEPAVAVGLAAFDQRKE